ncbi:hypothetical protein KVR01_007177 [Diaporthe batatas]|uniref:uncharacterized protein n=1 Tax=Diaporthe batatas TaxID=748121 RepID=UPI001D03D60D|nr:uncharacterized protein KVR01_007177 [Diaporthe batatas]KAG8162699.1 hypothetical protein KVR01_007177 [Diaporthe batatas]
MDRILTHASGSAIWALAALLVFNVLRCIYNVLFHPLRRFPGPLTRRASGIPNLISMLGGKWTIELLPMVEKYGPVVRIRPGELLFTGPDAWKDIYSHQNGALIKGEEFSKWEIFYRTPGVPVSILGESRDNHTLIRRQFNYGFSDKILRDQESIVKGYVDLLMQRLRERCNPRRSKPEKGAEEKKGTGTSFDLRRWYNYTTFDIIGDMAFGEPFGSLEAGSESELVRNIESGLARQPIGTAFKLAGLGWLITWIAGPRSRFRRESAQKTAERLRRRMALNFERPDLIGSLLRKQEDWNMPFEQLRSNAGLLVVAGSETTATLLCGVTYLLLRSPACLRKVTDEVRSSFESEHDITFSSVQNLPYMLACLREGLRRYPPVAGPLPRVVPKGGAHIAGHFVPEDTVVGIAQWPMNHSTRNFSDPFAFKPERFLDPEQFPDDKLDAAQPFSTGPRDCIGKNLAYAEMRTILARLLFNFDMELADPEVDWLDQRVYFLWTKQALNVRLTPVR